MPKRSNVKKEIQIKNPIRRECKKEKIKLQSTTVRKANPKKKLLPTKYVALRRYFVEDNTIVKVDKNGTLTAMKQGKTTLYIKAANGVTTKVTIIVKERNIPPQLI